MNQSTVSTSFFNRKTFSFEPFAALPFFPGAHLFTRTAAACQSFSFQQNLFSNCFAASHVVSASPSFYQIPSCLSISFFKLFNFSCHFFLNTFSVFRKRRVYNKPATPCQTFLSLLQFHQIERLLINRTSLYPRLRCNSLHGIL